MKRNANSINAFVKADHKKIREVMLELYGQSGKRGLTDDEIYRTGRVHNCSIRPSRIQLWKKGFLVDTDKQRLTASKNEASVFALASEYPDKALHPEAQLKKSLKSKGFRTYAEYLRDNDYRERRQSWMEQSDHKCFVSGRRTYPVVHHLNYDNLGNEELGKDVIILNKDFHKLVEGLIEMGSRRDSAHLELMKILGIEK